MLVVEDDADSREALADYLEQCGATVSTAGSAIDGLATTASR